MTLSARGERADGGSTKGAAFVPLLAFQSTTGRRAVLSMIAG
ncbi:MAG TPA: hypothetical protein PK970_00610 [Hyphomicrobiaceae bacterium]|nr:hypothetical protein [Hyphomicrobiaceae bacterium]